MRKHIRMTLLCVALALANRAEAQYDVLFSHYYDMAPSFNPAAVGKETAININAAHSGYAGQLPEHPAWCRTDAHGRQTRPLRP